MRWIVLLAILVVVAFALGWWYVRDTNDTREIIIDKEEVITDTEEAIEKGRQWLDDVAGEGDQPDTGDELEPAQDPERPETPEPETQGANP